jgi:hypothetical protein
MDRFDGVYGWVLSTYLGYFCDGSSFRCLLDGWLPEFRGILWMVHSGVCFVCLVVGMGLTFWAAIPVLIFCVFLCLAKLILNVAVGHLFCIELELGKCQGKDGRRGRAQAESQLSSTNPAPFPPAYNSRITTYPKIFSSHFPPSQLH